MSDYRVVIHEIRSGRFEAVIDGLGLACRSHDPEHAICRAMVAAGLPDGSVEFVHGPSGMVAMRARSAHRMAEWTVHHDARSGFVRKRFKSSAGSGSTAQDGDEAAGGSGSSGFAKLPRTSSLPDSPGNAETDS